MRQERGQEMETLELSTEGWEGDIWVTKDWRSKVNVERAFIKGCFEGGLKVHSPLKASQGSQCGYILEYASKHGEESED